MATTSTTASSTTTTTSSSSSNILNDQLNIVKDCNYRLINSIKATESIQMAKDSINVDQPDKGFEHCLRKIKRLVYFVSLEVEELLQVLAILDSLQITGHLKHNRRARKERKRLRQQQKKSGIEHPTTTTTEQHKKESELEISHSDLLATKLSELNNNDDDDSYDSSDDSESSSDSSSDEEEDARYGPHKLRKFRKLTQNKIIDLINYLELLHNQLLDINSKVENKQNMYINVPYDMAIRDSFEQSHRPPMDRNTDASSSTSSPSSTSSSTSSPNRHPGHAHHQHQHATRPGHTSNLSPANHERCCSPLLNSRFKELNIDKPIDFSEIDSLQLSTEDIKELHDVLRASGNHNLVIQSPKELLQKYLSTCSNRKKH